VPVNVFKEICDQLRACRKIVNTPTVRWMAVMVLVVVIVSKNP
jgi:hypothetical protein